MEGTVSVTDQAGIPGEPSPVGPAPRRSPLSYGMAPVATAGAITLLCGALLVGGGFSVISKAINGPGATPPGVQEPVAIVPEIPSTTDGGTTSTTGPTSPPERESAPKTPEKNAPTDRVYTIVWGDTLSQIAVDSGVSVQRLGEYNHIPNVDLIYAEAPLRIPYLLIPVD